MKKKTIFKGTFLRGKKFNRIKIPNGTNVAKKKFTKQIYMRIWKHDSMIGMFDMLSIEPCGSSYFREF